MRAADVTRTDSAVAEQTRFCRERAREIDGAATSQTAKVQQKHPVKFIMAFIDTARSLGSASKNGGDDPELRGPKGRHQSLFVTPMDRESREYGAIWPNPVRGEFAAGVFYRLVTAASASKRLTFFSPWSRS
jgi:hypothetical protein